MKKTILLLIIPCLIIALTGCDIKIGRQDTPSQSQTGQFFKSIDGGKTWRAKISLLSTEDSPKTIGQVDIKTIALDPQDNQAIYLGTYEHGAYCSYDSGESWQAISGLARMVVNDLAVDPTSKCVLYAATDNKIMKSTDCSRSWQEAYFESRVQQTMTVLAIDVTNPLIIYVGTSEGDLIKSTDRGKSWSTIQRFDSQINEIIVEPTTGRTIYVATAKKGIYKSANAGQTWFDLNDGLKEYSSSKYVTHLIQSKQNSAFLIAASKYGLLKTLDGGLTWQSLDLLTPPKGTVIYSLAFDPQNDQIIYYGTNFAFYKTVNGGKNWETQKLPTNRAATALIVDSVDGQVIYLGLKRLK